MQIKTSQEYEESLRRCQRCAPSMKGVRADTGRADDWLEPRPIVLALRKKPLMLIGQAPGLTEYETGEPFSGSAGVAIRKVFDECGCSSSYFDDWVHSSAVVKCFPGSKVTTKGDRTRREDIKPSSQMISNCSSFLRLQLEIVDPACIVLLGSVPLAAYLYWKDGSTGQPRLEEWVGRVDIWQGRQVIPLAHTSGLSTWLNKPMNKELQANAKLHLTTVIGDIARAGQK